MYNQQTFGVEYQRPPSYGRVLSIVHDAQAGGLLGNNAVQSAARSIDLPQPIRERIDAVGPRPRRSLARSKLEALKRRRFTPEGKAERVARSLAALHQKVSIQLTPEEWRWIAEDPDVEDQFE
jgi:hypothetical protein